MISWFDKKKKAKKAVRQCAEGAKAYIGEQYVSPASFASFAPDAEAVGAVPDRAYDPAAVGAEVNGDEVKSRLTDEYYQNVLKDAYPPEEEAPQYVQLDGTPTRSATAEQTFAQTVTALMNAGGMDEKELCRAARIDRAVFGRIMAEPDYVPTKDNVVSIAAALKLNPAGASALLSKAGYEFSRGNKRDLALEYCFREGVCDVRDINTVLDKLGEKKLEK